MLPGAKRFLSSPENLLEPSNKITAIAFNSTPNSESTLLSDSAHLYSLPLSTSEETVIMASNNSSDQDMDDDFTDFICIEVGEITIKQ